MFVLKDNFLLSLVVSKINDFSQNGVCASEFENFLSNLTIDLINSLPDASKHTLGYYFNSYSFEIYSKDFYDRYSFISEFESKYSF